jgi:uncharacterized protein (DUF952 family)
MIYHIVAEAEYRELSDGQQYLPSNFAADGFIHCSLEASVIPVANDYYAGVSGTLLLLAIDPAGLKAPVKYEAAAPAADGGTSHLGTSPVFPHIYGPIDVAAIDGVGILARGAQGYAWPAELVPPAEYFGRG